MSNNVKTLPSDAFFVRAYAIKGDDEFRRSAGYKRPSIHYIKIGHKLSSSDSRGYWIVPGSRQGHALDHRASLLRKKFRP